MLLSSVLSYLLIISMQHDRILCELGQIGRWGSLWEDRNRETEEQREEGLFLSAHQR